ncbi:MAG: cation transporter, partial [Clostridiales bacterium]|nr:cation transporter [Clostridiales bacterium]
WVAVLIVSIVLTFIDIPILDPILSLIISTYMLKNVISGLLKITNMLLQGVPDGFDVHKTEEYILNNNPSVMDVHDMRVWTLDGEENIITFHITVEEKLSLSDIVALKRDIKAQLNTRGLNSVTIDVENMNNCSDASVEDC